MAWTRVLWRAVLLLCGLASSAQVEQTGLNETLHHRAAAENCAAARAARGSARRGSFGCPTVTRTRLTVFARHRPLMP